MPKSKKLQLNEDTIWHLQKYMSKKVAERGFADETLQERLLLLVEEVGELVNACRKISGMHTDQNREIGHTPGEKLADVINMTFAVGNELGVDIEKEFRAKKKR